MARFQRGAGAREQLGGLRAGLVGVDLVLASEESGAGRGRLMARPGDERSLANGIRLAESSGCYDRRMLDLPGISQRDLLVAGALRAIGTQAWSEPLAHTMESKRLRSFGMLDGRVLNCATLGGLVLCMGLLEVLSIASMDIVVLQSLTRRGRLAPHCYQFAVYFIESDARSISHTWAGYAAYWAQRVSFWACPCLTTWTVAVAILAFVPPRPAVRRLMRRPGVMASIAFIVAFTALSIAMPSSLIEPAPRFYPERGTELYWDDWWIAVCFALPRVAALCVAVSWVTLAASGRCRRQGEWLDRLGTALGVCWLGLGLMRIVASALEAFVM